MSEWKRLRLGNVASIKHGYAFKGTDFSDSGPGPRVLTPGNFAIGGGFKTGKPKYYRGEVPDGFRLNPGDLVVTMTDLSKSGDTLGYPAIIPDEPGYLHNQRIGLVEINAPQLIDKGFLYYAFRTARYRTHVLAGATGSTVRHTSPSRILGYTLTAPNLTEQKAIGAALGALDDKIAVNDRLAATARELGQTHFRAATSDDDVEELELGDVTEFLNRGVAPRYSEDQSELPVLNQRCIGGGRAGTAAARRTLSDNVPSPKLLRVNDVLINSTGIGTLGRVARWTRDEPYTVDSHITIVRFDANMADPVVAGFAVLDAQHEIESLGEGSTGQTELKRTKLRALRLGLPSRTGAAQLRLRLDALERRGDAALEESHALAELRDTLLPRLMSGELRVRDAERTVEEAL